METLFAALKLAGTACICVVRRKIAKRVFYHLVSNVNPLPLLFLLKIGPNKITLDAPLTNACNFWRKIFVLVL